MVTAIVLMNVERGKIDTVAQRLLEHDGVVDVYSVAGQYDMVAVLRSPTNEGIADLMTMHLREISEITRTETLMAFKAYSRHDLGAMFSIGNDEHAER